MLKAVITPVELIKESWFVNCYSDFICSVSRRVSSTANVFDRRRPIREQRSTGIGRYELVQDSLLRWECWTSL